MIGPGNQLELVGMDLRYFQLPVLDWQLGDPEVGHVLRIPLLPIRAATVFSTTAFRSDRNRQGPEPSIGVSGIRIIDRVLQRALGISSEADDQRTTARRGTRLDLAGA